METVDIRTVELALAPRTGGGKYSDICVSARRVVRLMPPGLALVIDPRKIGITDKKGRAGIANSVRNFLANDLGKGKIATRSLCGQQIAVYRTSKGSMPEDKWVSFTQLQKVASDEGKKFGAMFAVVDISNLEFSDGPRGRTQQPRHIELRRRSREAANHLVANHRGDNNAAVLFRYDPNFGATLRRYRQIVLVAARSELKSLGVDAVAITRLPRADRSLFYLVIKWPTRSVA